MTEWQDISTVPKNGEDYLFTNGIDCAVGCFNPCYISYDTSLINPTHWMPLPELPKKKHECRKDAWVCVEDRNEPGLILVSSCGDWIKVNECPICGDKSDHTAG